MADNAASLEALLDLLEQVESDPTSVTVHEELRDLLLADAGLRTVYLLRMHLISGLQWILNPQCPSPIVARVADSSPEDIAVVACREPGVGMWNRAIRSLGRSVVFSASAAALVVAAYITFISWGMLDKEDHELASVAPAETDGTASGDHGLLSGPAVDAVAEVSASDNAQWHHQKQVGPVAASVADKFEVLRGELLQLASGIVELKLKQGVSLFIEGPAEWTIDGRNNATLKRGKLVAQVPKQAVGFTLSTPTARIIDLGTQFGVEVLPDGTAEVAVLRGKVDVEDATSSETGRVHHLTAGESARVTGSGWSGNAHPLLAGEFHRLAESITLGKPRRLTEAEQYAACVRALKPLVYLPISRQDGMQPACEGKGKFIAQFSRTAGPGDAWEKGPFGDALRFRGNQHCDRLTVEAVSPETAPLTFSRGPDTALPFTLTLWARCMPGQFTGTLIGKGIGYHEQFLLDILDGKFRFVTFCADRKYFPITYSTVPFDGSWQHVAAVFDPEHKLDSLYVNGRLEATTALPDATLFATDVTTYIGNRPFLEDDKRLTLDGALDDIAIFDRVLQPHEISALYRLLLTTPSTDDAKQP